MTWIDVSSTDDVLSLGAGAMFVFKKVDVQFLGGVMMLGEDLIEDFQASGGFTLVLLF